MRKQKLTRWFPAKVKPVRPGVYQRRYDEGEAYCEWNGMSWMCGTLISRVPDALNQAAGCRVAAPDQCLPWRGLSENPDA